jgi:hypothetical protein
VEVELKEHIVHKGRILYVENHKILCSGERWTLFGASEQSLNALYALNKDCVVADKHQWLLASIDAILAKHRSIPEVESRA